MQVQRRELKLRKVTNEASGEESLGSHTLYTASSRSIKLVAVLQGKFRKTLMAGVLQQQLTEAHLTTDRNRHNDGGVFKDVPFAFDVAKLEAKLPLHSMREMPDEVAEEGKVWQGLPFVASVGVSDIELESDVYKGVLLHLAVSKKIQRPSKITGLFLVS